MSKYVTKQRRILLDFLSEHADEILSPKQISQMLSDSGISASSVYRNLTDLEATGKVRRVTKSNSREALYQFIDVDICKNRLHFLCNSCGKTFHVSAQSAALLQNQLEAAEGFQIDRANTILYGTCGTCSKTTCHVKELTQILTDRRHI